jgi:hypothetical protein
MLTLRPFSRRIKAGGLGRAKDSYNHCHFHCAPKFDTPVLAHMLDSLVRVSRRGKENHFVNAQSKRTRVVHQLTRPPQPQRQHNKSCWKYDTRNTGFLRFLFSNFRYSLTLFSKFFASFPHGTCTLSVSHQYLAFDGIYHPLRAAIPNNSTQTCSLIATVKREYHPLCCPVPRDFDRRK